jgi:hypothetical protein
MDQDKIDSIIDEVVRRLLAQQDQQPAPVAESEVVIPGRVITMDCLQGQLEGQSQLVVCELAVVTPLVQDYLKEKKITLVRRLLAAS